MCIYKALQLSPQVAIEDESCQKVDALENDGNLTLEQFYRFYEVYTLHWELVSELKASTNFVLNVY